MCDFFFSKHDSWKPPTYQTKLTSFEKNCHILRRSLNGIMFIMRNLNFTGQKFGLILKDWTSVIKLKNFNGNATITLFIPKVDLEKWIHPMEDVTFVKNRIFKDLQHLLFKCSITIYINLTDSCWLILSVFILMSFDFPLGRLFGVR